MTKHFIIGLSLYGKPLCQIDYPNRTRPIKVGRKYIDVINHDKLVTFIEKKHPSLKGKPYRVESMNLKQ